MIYILSCIAFVIGIFAFPLIVGLAKILETIGVAVKKNIHKMKKYFPSTFWLIILTIFGFLVVILWGEKSPFFPKFFSMFGKWGGGIGTFTCMCLMSGISAVFGYACYRYDNWRNS